MDGTSAPRRHGGSDRTVGSNRSRLGTLGALLGAGAAAAGVALAVERQARRAERRHPPTGRLIEVAGVKVHVEIAGDGPALVLIHGNGAMVQDWAVSGLVDRLRRHYRVIAIDRPGFGYTERPRSTLWTPAAQAELIRKTLDRLGIARPIVVGHSWGTLVALALALDNPDFVRALVLLSGYYFPTARLDVWALSPPAIPVLGDAMRYTVSPLIGRLLAPKIVAKVFEPLPVPRRFEAGFPLDLSLRPSQLRASAEDSAFMVPAAAALSRRYGELTLPLAIVSGSEDRVVTPRRQSERLASEIAHSTLYLVRGVGHMVHYSGHEAIADAVAELAGRSGAAADSAEKGRMEASPGIEPGCKDLQSSA
jgi:pimeloyl-ACP methyl ester carboxylesterase